MALATIFVFFWLLLKLLKLTAGPRKLRRQPTETDGLVGYFVTEDENAN